jgi:hypothetical protein
VDTAEYRSLANNSLKVFNQIMGISSGGGPSLKFLTNRTEMDAYYQVNENQIAMEYDGKSAIRGSSVPLLNTLIIIRIATKYIGYKIS